MSVQNGGEARIHQEQEKSRAVTLKPGRLRGPIDSALGSIPLGLARAGCGWIPGGRQCGGSLPGCLAWAPIRSGIEKRHGVTGPSLSREGRPDIGPLSVKKGSPEDAREECHDRARRLQRRRACRDEK